MSAHCRFDVFVGCGDVGSAAQALTMLKFDEPMDVPHAVKYEPLALHESIESLYSPLCDVALDDDCAFSVKMDLPKTFTTAGAYLTRASVRERGIDLFSSFVLDDRQRPKIQGKIRKRTASNGTVDAVSVKMPYEDSIETALDRVKVESTGAERVSRSRGIVKSESDSDSALALARAGVYSKAERRAKIRRFHRKWRQQFPRWRPGRALHSNPPPLVDVCTVRKDFADNRVRVHGRFTSMNKREKRETQARIVAATSRKASAPSKSSASATVTTVTVTQSRARNQVSHPAGTSAAPQPQPQPLSRDKRNPPRSRSQRVWFSFDSIDSLYIGWLIVLDLEPFFTLTLTQKLAQSVARWMVAMYAVEFKIFDTVVQ
jgi:hypothetical protein